MDDRPIGVFDSGLGGLTVVKEIMKILPFEDIVYFGDTARIPYGTRSKETVMKYSEQCINFLLQHDIKLIVIACNTASSFALDEMKSIFSVPIVGVVNAGAKTAVNTTANNNIGVIGTQGTIRSKAYYNLIKSMNPDINVYDKACTLFVPLVEEGWSDTNIAVMTAHKYLKGLKSNNIDTLVLGCTHYPLLYKPIQWVIGNGVTLVNPGVGTAQEVYRILESEELLSDEKESVLEFYISDYSQSFRKIAGQFLGREIEHAVVVDVSSY